ncbi:37S ribosomal protein S22 [Lecanora helva]
MFNASVEHQEPRDPASPAQMEAVVRQARKTFGETLPQDFLSEEEYLIYERLYGPPSATTLPEDVDLLKGIEEQEPGTAENVLMRENAEGGLEEIVYEEDEVDVSERETEDDVEVAPDVDEDFQSRLATLREQAATESERKATENLETKHDFPEDTPEPDVSGRQEFENEDMDDFEEETISDENGEHERTHPLTVAGRSGTSPATIFMPKQNVVDPINALLSDASNRQLAEVALKTFGGPGLPNSTATFSRPNLKQQPIALEASQSRMGEMEGNAFMAAIMPGAYATILSILVEIRKRLGSNWLRDLIQKPGGPRILDAGAGGAGILAWREVLRAEWELMHPGKASVGKDVPYGKSTVVTGSAALRNRASHLLEDTTFIPRLPDYNPSRDHPSLKDTSPQPRKQYDIILAPYTLWTLREDYMRKNQVQNFWSLLDPNGGVLVLVEKGIPRGFELIAAARETLLKYHVSSPGSEEVETTIEDASRNRFGPKEKGMIIAPCTNHGKCPMYITAGKSQGRKDYCHFSQRFIRPPYLQRILDGRDRNHEDIRFSYVALQRGKDQRETDNVVQGQSATEAAFSGYEDTDHDIDSAAEANDGSGQVASDINPLSLPRAILPPIKRRGHVTLDLCTPSGKIERWTVPKSFSKQAYHDARKSRWGDLWALGAKTRVQRNIRVGLKKGKTQTKDILDSKAEDTDELREIPIPRQRMGQSIGTRKQEKQKRKMMKMMEEDDG